MQYRDRHPSKAKKTARSKRKSPVHGQPPSIHHVAVFSRNYLQLILEGKKRVECRLLRTRRPPFRTVAQDHLIWLKEPGGPIRGHATVKRVRRWENLTPKSLAQLRRKYNRYIHAEPQFWREKANARYATLIWLTNVTACPSFRIQKSDRRGWVTLSSPLPFEDLLF